MERTLSVEEKIRRAEEIYNRRRNNTQYIYNVKENVKLKKDFKILKKIIFQIMVCISIYFFYYSVNNNYIFSEDLIKTTQEMLSYDINFKDFYESLKTYINQLYKLKENEDKEAENNIITNSNEQDDVTKESNEEKNIIIEENIGGAKLENKEESVISEKEEIKKEIIEVNEMSQEEKDIMEIKNNISFIKPVEGKISSAFGWRNPTTATVPKYHTGLDIAAPNGTIIKSATDGIVSLSSSQGDYRKTFKNKKWICNNNICTL